MFHGGDALSLLPLLSIGFVSCYLKLFAISDGTSHLAVVPERPLNEKLAHVLHFPVHFEQLGTDFGSSSALFGSAFLQVGVSFWSTALTSMSCTGRGLCYSCFSQREITVRLDCHQPRSPRWAGTPRNLVRSCGFLIRFGRPFCGKRSSTCDNHVVAVEQLHEPNIVDRA